MRKHELKKKKKKGLIDTLVIEQQWYFGDWTIEWPDLELAKMKLIFNSCPTEP